MACNYATVIQAAADSGILKVTDEVRLLQVIAQLNLDYVSQNTALATDLPSVMARTVTSGINKVTDQNELLQIIGQLECDRA